MFNKLIRSSTDPKALSLTVRGILVSVLPIAIAVLGIDEAVANGIVDAVVNLVYYGASLVSVVMTLYGLIRKVKLKRWSAD